MALFRRVMVLALAAFASAGWIAALEAKELRVGLAAEPSAMDPHFHNLTPNSALLSHVFEHLVETAPEGKLIPGLAVSWKTLDDTTWEFKLRPNVKWHDGSPFTADDVQFTFERAPNVPNSPSSFATSTKGKTIVKIDDLTIHVKTATPSPLTPNDLSNVLIVSKKHGTGATTADYNSGKAAIGTGAFKFAEYTPGAQIVLIRNDDYWGTKSVWDKVIFKPITSNPSRVAALEAGDVDLIEDVPPTDIARIKANPKFTVAQATSRRVIYLHMDQFRDVSPFIKAKDGSTIKNPLKDRRVRLALSKAINRDAIVTRVMENAAVPAGQLLATGFFGVNPDVKPEPYDPEGAKKLLAEAGFANGFKMTLHGPIGRYTNDVKIEEAVAQMLTRVGVETSVESLPAAVFFTRASTGDNGQPEFSFILVGWGADTGEVSGSLKPLLGTFDKTTGFGTANRGRYSNSALDALISEAQATVDDTKRQAVLEKAVKVAMDDVGLIPIDYPISTWAARKGLKIEARADEYTFVVNVIEQ